MTKAQLDKKPEITLEIWECVFKACADQTRLRLLNMMAVQGEICVCHFVEVLQTNQPKVSRHLAYLKRVGLVNDRKDGLLVYYRLAVPLNQKLAKVLNCITECCAGVAEMQNDLRLLQHVLKSNSPKVIGRPAKAQIRISEAEQTTFDEMRIELL